ncbi:MAG: hypothetical protein WCB67_06245 [Solirubrobacteraceae bacterium]
MANTLDSAPVALVACDAVVLALETVRRALARVVVAERLVVFRLREAAAFCPRALAALRVLGVVLLRALGVVLLRVLRVEAALRLRVVAGFGVLGLLVVAIFSLAPVWRMVVCSLAI